MAGRSASRIRWRRATLGIERGAPGMPGVRQPHRGRKPVRQQPAGAPWLRELAAPATSRREPCCATSTLTLAPDTPAGRLSIAQKHLVQIARALAHESRVLILDEPTASLSQRECAELFRIVRKLRDAGRALLFISHKFDEIVRIADRYAVFRDGVSVGAGLLAATDRDALIRLMVGRDVVTIVPEAGDLARRGTAARRGICAGRASSPTSRSRCAGARSSASTAWWAPGARSSRRCCSASTRADAGRVTLATAAMTAGLALVPEDRQTQGAILPFSIAANLALPNLATLAPRGWCSARREADLARDWIGRLAIKRVRSGAGGAAACPAATSRRWSSPSGWRANRRC